MRYRATGASARETDLERNLVSPPGAQRVWLSLVRRVHVSGYNSESKLTFEMHRTRDMMAEIVETVETVEAVTVATGSAIGPRTPATRELSSALLPRPRPPLSRSTAHLVSRSHAFQCSLTLTFSCASVRIIRSV
jgi:hypothetical protein